MKFEAKFNSPKASEDKNHDEMETMHIKRDLIKSFILSFLVCGIIAAIYLMDNNPNLFY